MTTATLIPLQTETTPPVHIASLALQLVPEQLTATKEWLVEQEGVEIHAEDAHGKLVVVMETRDERAITQLLDAAADRPGIINAALVYHEILTEEPTP